MIDTNFIPNITRITADWLNGVNDKWFDLTSVKDYGASGNGTSDDTSAIQTALNSGKPIFFPKGTYKVTSSILVPSGAYLYAKGNAVIQGNGITGIFTFVYPSVGTTIDGLTIDGGKTSGTADVVTLIYAAGSTTTPTVKSKHLTVQNCTLRNASAGVAFENALNCLVTDNHIDAMWRHTSGPYAGSYGYGVVFNGCQNSKVCDNTIGTSDFPIERHGVYLPVFRDADTNPTVLNFATSIQITNNRISVKYDPANEPFSSCVESWNYFDVSIENNHLIGGVRGINSAPDYQNGSRVQIIGNLIKENEICIRNGRTDKGTAPGTYYFEAYQIEGNILAPLTSVAAHQAVFLQGVKNIIFNDNYCKGNASTSFAFGYYDVTFNNIVADLISASDNIISGFTQGFYLANVTKFVDSSSFKSFTGNPLPYTRVANIGSSEMKPIISPATSFYVYSTGDWAGVTYYEAVLDKMIRYNGSYWEDHAGFRVRGPTANRPSNVSSSSAAATGLHVGLPYGFRYFDEGAGVVIYWNGIAWATSQQPAPPLGDTTTNLNTFKTTYPSALSYGAVSWNTTTSKPVFYNANTGNWVYSDGTAI